MRYWSVWGQATPQRSTSAGPPAGAGSLPRIPVREPRRRPPARGTLPARGSERGLALSPEHNPDLRARHLRGGAPLRGDGVRERRYAQRPAARLRYARSGGGCGSGDQDSRRPESGARSGHLSPGPGAAEGPAVEVGGGEGYGIRSRLPRRGKRPARTERDTLRDAYRNPPRTRRRAPAAKGDKLAHPGIFERADHEAASGLHQGTPR
jgi:hypothetical protein